MPIEGSKLPPLVNNSVHKELEKFKFPDFMGATDKLVAEAWLKNMEMCFTHCYYTSNMKVCMEVLQLKGSALLWWKKLLP
jgi:hypothetical protein